MNEQDRQTELLEEILEVQRNHFQWLKNRERAYWKLSIWITVVVLVIVVGLMLAAPFLEQL